MRNGGRRGGGRGGGTPVVDSLRRESALLLTSEVSDHLRPPLLLSSSRPLATMGARERGVSRRRAAAEKPLFTLLLLLPIVSCSRLSDAFTATFSFAVIFVLA